MAPRIVGGVRNEFESNAIRSPYSKNLLLPCTRLQRGGVEFPETGGGDGARVEISGPLGGGFFGEFWNVDFFQPAVRERSRELSEIQERIDMADEDLDGIILTFPDACEFGGGGEFRVGAASLGNFRIITNDMGKHHPNGEAVRDVVMRREGIR